MSGLSNVTSHFSLIRSKDAGPFMLTLDLFFVDGHARRAFMASGELSAEKVGALYGVASDSVQFYDLADIDAVKISFPRPVPSGEFGDTDITGGQQYALLVEHLASLEVEGAGPSLVVRPASGS